MLCGMNARRNLEWFLTFVEKDIGQLRAGDWLNLVEDAWLMVSGLPLDRGGATEPLLVPEDDAQQLTRENLTAAQEFVREWLTAWARQNTRRKEAGSREPVTARLLFRQPLKGAIHSVSFFADDSGTASISVEADDVRDALLFALGATWAGMDACRLLACPTCARLFLVEHGRQVFCSFKCKNKDVQDRYRATHRDKESARGRSHYEKKVKEKLGPSVRIAKRPRVVKQAKPRQKEK
ncbi:MAG: hypothetical protein EXR78_03595 [Deltaproteobacteria bacterium]|nr:hypothetical protein [Deltaproteobacteria bacterium]